MDFLSLIKECIESKDLSSQKDLLGCIEEKDLLGCIEEILGLEDRYSYENRFRNRSGELEDIGD